MTAKLRRMSADTDTGVKTAIGAGADDVLKDMQAHAPFRSGKMRSAIVKRVTKSGASARVGIFRKKIVYIARFIEFGTKSHTIRPRIAKVLKLGGRAFAGGAVEHPGIVARPFIFPALDRRRQAITQKIIAAVKAAPKRGS